MIYDTLACMLKEKGLQPKKSNAKKVLNEQSQKGKLHIVQETIRVGNKSAVSGQKGETEDVVAKIAGEVTQTAPETLEGMATAPKPPPKTPPAVNLRGKTPVEKSFAFPLNLQFDEDDARDFGFKLMSLDPIILPQEMDYTLQMSPIKNQKHLGSCVGFAATAMKEWQERVEHENEITAGKKYKRDKEFDLSEQWVYHSCKKIDPWPDQEGTSIRCAMKVLHKIGVPTEKAWPYSDVTVGEPKSWAHMVARWSMIKSYERVRDLVELKTALYETGPLVIGILCFRGIFEVGSKGKVPMPKKGERHLGGHAVCAVGYDNNTGLVKFKNSWGTGWGQKGYGYIPFQYVAKYAIDMWAAKDMAVTKEMLKGARTLL